MTAYDRDPGRCRDCGALTKPRPVRPGSWEFYMVRDEAWKQAGGPAWVLPNRPETAFNLCVGCLEARLGRNLILADFTDYPGCSVVPSSACTPRLLSRFAPVYDDVIEWIARTSRKPDPGEKAA